jgi:hypothetical protein
VCYIVYQFKQAVSLNKFFQTIVSFLNFIILGLEIRYVTCVIPCNISYIICRIMLERCCNEIVEAFDIGSYEVNIVTPMFVA